MTGSVLIVSPHHERYAAEVARLAPEVPTAGCTGDADAPADLSPFDAALAWRMDPALLGRWPSLRWVQLVSAGADHILSLPTLRDEVEVTSVRGIHAGPIASYVMMMMPALAMGLRAMGENQRARRWKPWAWRDLEGRLLCQVGMGAIGCEIARRARASGMRVVGVKRTLEAGAAALPADRVVSAAELGEALAEADYAVLAVPMTRETAGMFGAGMFRRMKEGSFLVNVARGDVLVEADLVRALREGPLAGAALDVFAEEPLPAESPLWEMENVLITPHVSGLTRDYVEKVCRLFLGNWRRRASGLPLERVVDKRRGY